MDPLVKTLVQSYFSKLIGEKDKNRIGNQIWRVYRKHDSFFWNRCELKHIFVYLIDDTKKNCIGKKTGWVDIKYDGRFEIDAS